MSDTPILPETPAELPKPKRKWTRRKPLKAKAAPVAAKPAALELAGLTTVACATACNADGCVISGRPICGHPYKGGLRGDAMTDPAALARYKAAQKLLGKRQVELRYA